jgi:hypothetical protein
MRVPAVHLPEPAGEVHAIQPTWHCVLRFRQRGSHAAGTDAALDALRRVLLDAHVDRWPPPWAAGQAAERWAVSGDYAFPLHRSAGGLWVAPTCLRRDAGR